MADKAVSLVQKIFDWRSKTFWGTALAILSIVMDSALDFEGLPAIGLRLVQVVLVLFTIFGITDAAKQEQAALIEKIQNFVKSSPAWGVLIGMLAHLAETLPETEGIPNGLIAGAKALGVLLATMGLRQAAASARGNYDPRAPEAVEKYRKIAQ